MTKTRKSLFTSIDDFKAFTRPTQDDVAAYVWIKENNYVWTKDHMCLNRVAYAWMKGTCLGRFRPTTLLNYKGLGRPSLRVLKPHVYRSAPALGLHRPDVHVAYGARIALQVVDTKNQYRLISEEILGPT